MKRFKLKLSTVVFSLGLVSPMFITGSALAATMSASSVPGLMEVYRMASEHDAVLAQARAQFQANQQGVTTARSALLPQVSADGSYFKSDSSYDSGSASLAQREASLSVNQALYNKQNWTRFEQSKDVLHQAEYAMQSSEQDLILRVTEQYFNVLLAQESLKLFQAKEASDSTQLERAQASAEVGLASKTDVLQAKSSYDLSKSNRIGAENALDVANENLMKLTGQPLALLKILPSSVQFDNKKLQLTAVEAQAAKDNLAVKQAEEQVLVAEKEIDVQKSGYYPTVGLQAKYSDTAYSDMSGSVSPLTQDGTNTSIGVSVSVPLYSGGGTDSQVSAARFQAKASTQALRNAREQAKLEARVQVRNIENGISLIAAAREAVKSNDAFLEAAEEGYKVGLKNLLEVLTARSNQYDARNNLLKAIHDQVLNRLRLESALGDLTVDDLVAFDAMLSLPVTQ